MLPGLEARSGAGSSGARWLSDSAVVEAPVGEPVGAPVGAPVPDGATLLSQAELLSFRVALDKAEEAAEIGAGPQTYAASDAGVFPAPPRPCEMEPVTLLDIADRASAPAVGNSSGEGAFEQARNFQPTASEAGLSETSTGKGDINPHSTPDARAAQAMEAYGRMGIFGDANTEDGTMHKKIAKLCADKEQMTMLWLLVSSFIVIGIGVLLQKLPASAKNGESISFRWCYFAGGAIPLYYLAKWGTAKIFHTIEVVFLGEFLAHYESLTKALIRTATMGMLLLWYFVVFELAFCDGVYAATCASAPYQKMSTIIQRIVLCVLIATIASLIASVCTKAISTNFYRSTHFKKLHEALGSEFKLKALSSTRQRRRPKPSKQIFTKSTRADVRRSSKVLRPGNSTMNLVDLAHRGAPSEGGSELKDGSALVSGVVLDLPQQGTIPERPDPPRHRRMASGSAIADLFKVVSGSRPASRPPSEADDSYSATPTTSGNFDDDIVQFNLGKDILQQMPLEMLDNQDPDDLENLTDKEIERLRTAVVVKTYSNLIRQHRCRTPEEAKAQLADVTQFGKALFSNLRGAEVQRKYVTLQDFMLFYKDDNEGRRSATEAFRIFSTDLEARITRSQVIDRVQTLYKERADIATSLHNTETMMNSLESGLAGALHFLFIGFYFLVWNVDVLQGLSTFSATVLALSFIFGNSIRNTYEAMLFLFVQHPYDVGDWVTLDGEAFNVRKISLLNTSFLDFWNRPLTLTNTSLISKPILNLSRCSNHAEFTYFQVDVGAADTIKHELMSKLRQLCREKPTEYDEQYLDVKYYSVDQTNLKMTVLIIWWYKMSPDEWTRKREARDAAVGVASSVIRRYSDKGDATFSFHHKVEARGGGVPLANLL